MSTTWPVALADAWHPVAYGHEVRDKPVPVMLMDVPLVLFRHEGGVSALDDRCPHRNVPLSGGVVLKGAIVCPYHGWEFGPDGTCIKTPGSATCAVAAARSHKVIEHAGLIWVSFAKAPPALPKLLPEVEDPSFDRFWWPLPAANARMLDALENHLDAAHPHYLHPWLVRKPDRRKPVDVTFRTYADGAVAQYAETGTHGWLPRLFERSRSLSFGQLLAPATGQVRFEDDKGTTIAITVTFAPEGENRTRPYAHFASRKGMLPAWLKRWLIIAFHKQVLAQDKRMLETQMETIRKFGAPDYAIGKLDLLGPVIWRLANGQTQAETVEQHEFFL
jgi:phenylpropionate dioxygenase-like ring-hydroxylating dioxygenase large terminal subunit